LENSQCDFSTIRLLKHVGPFILIEYNQQVIIKFLVNDGLDAHQIAPKLAAQFGEDAYPLRTVQFWIDKARKGRENLHGAPRSETLRQVDLISRIQSRLDENPFQSARSMTDTLHLSNAPVLRYLHQELRFQCFHLPCVQQCVIEMLSELSTANEICRYLQRFPFSSAKILAKDFSSSLPTVHRILKTKREFNKNVKELALSRSE
jgi:hypothetical protein